MTLKARKSEPTEENPKSDQQLPTMIFSFGGVAENITVILGVITLLIALATQFYFNMPTIHTKKEDFIGMRKAGKLAAEVLDHITPFVKAGVTTEELDRRCHDFITSRGAIAAPLNYRGFPKSICTSTNEEVCHGIPSSSVILKRGDIINIDVTVILDGWHGDTSRMYIIDDDSTHASTSSDESDDPTLPFRFAETQITPDEDIDYDSMTPQQKLVRVTYESLMRAISVVRPGATLGDIGYAIQSYAEKHGCSVVRGFVGHGIGKGFHEPPQVKHYGKRGEGLTLKEGMFFTIEPMLNLGAADTRMKNDDGWTVVTKDGSLSAQFEHSIAVTATGYEIFTLSPQRLYRPN